jgi:hypothetical protein
MRKYESRRRNFVFDDCNDSRKRMTVVGARGQKQCDAMQEEGEGEGEWIKRSGGWGGMGMGMGMFKVRAGRSEFLDEALAHQPLSP